jgi:hypothetical protein
MRMQGSHPAPPLDTTATTRKPKTSESSKPCGKATTADTAGLADTRALIKNPALDGRDRLTSRRCNIWRPFFTSLSAPFIKKQPPRSMIVCLRIQSACVALAISVWPASLRKPPPAPIERVVPATDTKPPAQPPTTTLPLSPPGTSATQPPNRSAKSRTIVQCTVLVHCA